VIVLRSCISLQTRRTRPGGSLLLDWPVHAPHRFPSADAFASDMLCDNFIQTLKAYHQDRSQGRSAFCFGGDSLKNIKRLATVTRKVHYHSRKVLAFDWTNATELCDNVNGLFQAATQEIQFRKMIDSPDKHSSCGF
jgi:hypothetical protein